MSKIDVALCALLIVGLATLLIFRFTHQFGVL
jgi:hypothetical protein